jgi:hypothetical protein
MRVHHELYQSLPQPRTSSYRAGVGDRCGDAAVGMICGEAAVGLIWGGLDVGVAAADSGVQNPASPESPRRGTNDSAYSATPAISKTTTAAAAVLKNPRAKSPTSNE